jgi:hypothetical protein
MPGPLGVPPCRQPCSGMGGDIGARLPRAGTRLQLRCGARIVRRCSSPFRYIARISA